MNQLLRNISATCLLGILTIVPSRAESVTMPMDNLLQWNLQGTAGKSSNIKPGTERTPDGETSIEIEYAPTTDSVMAQFVELVRGKVVLMPERLGSIAFWVKGNGSGDTLSVRFIDAEKTTHQWTHDTKIDWIGWKRVTISLKPGAPTHRAWRAGERPEKGLNITPPLVFRSVVLQLNSVPAATSRNILVGGLHLSTY